MKTTILCALVAGGLLVACSDPERAEHRPVAGIDARHRDDINPFDELPGQIDEPFLQSFNEKLVAEIQKAPGRA
ncbi:MAG: hypothetical protein JXA90_02285, partial [Planctomycetes bacterium]|nr:hypothetical protein [Planctomycetota bacterium]